MKVSRVLIKKLKQAVKYAYAPYSKIQVGAVLYCANGQIFTGSNIENGSYSLTICAERVALFKALSEGVKDFSLILVYSPQYDFIIPCGACLQVLSEFAPEIIIATMNKNEEFKFLPLSTLLKKPFKIGR
jgi:cytidine deaminase|uniref:Cytidine deaminase n=1 Tax=candidate division WOR-3 bacterium TaxID=2052148 RepID=A0A7V3RIG0_UNCW3